MRNTEQINRVVNTVTKNFGYPKICLGFNWFAPIQCKKLFNKSTICYCLTGSTFLTMMANNDQKLSLLDLNSSDIVPSRHANEIVAMMDSDYVLPNSFLTQNHFLCLYPEFSNKFTRFPVELNNICVSGKVRKPLPTHPYKDRRYDIIFITSSFSRKIKNVELSFCIIRRYY